jgi:hypothetical protein
MIRIITFSAIAVAVVVVAVVVIVIAAAILSTTAVRLHCIAIP